MTDFEVYFSFYGLLLGLCVAQVANGVGHAVVSRRTTTLGLLTPMLAIFILLDIASFWVWAWSARDVISVSFASINIGLVIALAYYLATVLLFPLSNEPWQKLDDHYWSNKHLVIAGVMTANAIMVGHALVTRPELAGLLRFWVLQPLYWVPLIVLLFSKRKTVDVVSLGVLIAAYVLVSLAG